ncbi:hypothetical protein BY996DRAFT_6795150 [Phakopsora pachyrhizi]|nr:hypothetical protein BY996DRAFT_6795150 [Phakopsora pachyrhizi]
MSSYSKSKHSNFLHNLIHHESDKAMTFPEVEESKDSIVEVSEGSIDSRNNEVFFASQDPISSFSSPKENDSQIAIRNTWRKLPQNHLLENARKTELTKGIPINEYKATNNNEDNRPGLNLRPNNSKLRYEHSTSGKIKPDKVIFPSKKKDFDWKRLQKLRFDLSSPRQSAEINDDSTDGSRSGELSASEFTKFKAESSNLSLVKNYKTPNSETTYRKEKQDEKSGPNFSRTNTKLESFNSILKDLRGDMTQKFQKTPPTVDQGIVASDEVSSIKDAVRIKSRPNKQLFARLRPPRSKLLLKSSSDVRKIRGNQQKLADLTNPSYKGCLGNQKISKSSVIRNGSTVSNSIKHEDKLSDCMGKLTQVGI